jgi:hypothetical protein
MDMRIRFALLFSLLLLFAQPLFSQATPSVTYSYSVSKQVYDCVPGAGTTYLTIYVYSSIKVTVNGASQTAPNSATYFAYPTGSINCPKNVTNPVQVTLNGTNTNYIVTLTPAPNNQLSVSTAEDFFPTYKVLSILYAPPGNQSSQGYTASTTNGTTTTVGSTFTYSSNTDIGISSTVEGISGSGGSSTGFSFSSIFSSSETQTFTDANTYSNNNDSLSYYNPNSSNIPNHGLDEILIWLNPEVVVNGTGQMPSAFSLTAAPIRNYSGAIADMIGVAAQDMEPTTSGVVTTRNPNGVVGVTTVDLSVLEPQQIEGNGDTPTFMPGLAAVCSNQTLYQEQLAYDIANPTKANGNSGGTQYCTQANQCGCTFADFAPIVQQDALLGYTCQKNSSGVITSCAGSQYSQTTDPTTLDGSGKATCEKNPIPQGSDCRYVMVPAASGSTAPFQAELEEGVPYNHSVTDSNTSTLTRGGSQSQVTGETGGFSTPFFKLSSSNSWTWTNSESTGTTTGSANSMNLNLQTNTTSCSEWVSLFEDTIYHTFVFQTLGSVGCP